MLLKAEYNTKSLSRKVNRAGKKVTVEFVTLAEIARELKALKVEETLRADYGYGKTPGSPENRVKFGKCQWGKTASCGTGGPRLNRDQNQRLYKKSYFLLGGTLES